MLNHYVIRLTEVDSEEEERDDKNPPFTAIDDECPVDLES